MKLGSGKMTRRAAWSVDRKEQISQREPHWQELFGAANLMPTTSVAATGQAFENSKGDLAERMLAARDAAQAVGGEFEVSNQRRSLSSVANDGQSGRIARLYCARDDSPEPLRELRRLVTLQRAYNHMNAATGRREKDNEGALREYSAAERLVPDNAEMIYWHAIAR